MALLSSRSVRSTLRLALVLALAAGCAACARPPAPEPARALTPRGLENLVAFTRLLCYIRYFHPSDEAASLDWDAFAVHGVRAVEGAEDAAALARTLAERFAPVAPSVVISADTLPALASAAVPAGATEVLMWRYFGVGTGEARSVYRSERTRGPAPGGTPPDSFPDAREPLVVELGGGVRAAIPLAVYADAAGTLPRGDAAAAEPDVPFLVHGVFTGDDRAIRLADVARRRW